MQLAKYILWEIVQDKQLFCFFNNENWDKGEGRLYWLKTKLNNNTKIV